MSEILKFELVKCKNVKENCSLYIVLIWPKVVFNSCKYKFKHFITNL